MSVDKLIRMAEQIGANVSISTDPDIVAERLADHLRRFWDPRMREELCRAADQGVVLSPAVTAAVAMLKSSK